MTSPGGYSAGTAFLDVIPSFRGVQKAIEREVRGIERAIGKDAGDEFGKEFEKSAVKAVDKALGTTKASAKKSGKEAADEYAGQFAERFQQAISRVSREMGSFKFDAQFDDKKLQNQFNAIRRDIDDLAKKKLKIGDAGPAMIELDRIDARLKKLQDVSVDLDVRANLGAAAAEIEAFRKRIQQDAKINVELEIKADRQIGLFERALKQRLKAALDSFPPIEFDADVTPAQNRLMELRAEMIALGDQRIGIDMDGSQALAEMERLRVEMATLANDEDIEFNVRTDAAGAASELLAIRALAELVDKTEVEIKVDVDKNAVSRIESIRRKLLGADEAGREGANGFRAFNAAILTGALVLPAVVPALGAVAGALALIGPLALGVGAGLGVMLVGFSGIGDAVSALGKVQDTSAKDSMHAARTMRDASASVEDAQRSLSRARADAGQAAEDAARRVSDAVESQERAEQDLVRAQQDVIRAQEAVNRARDEARERIEDLRLSIRGGALAEREAVLDLARAQREYDEAVSSGEFGGEAIERRLIDLEQAKLRVDSLRESNADMADEQAEFDRTGIEGSREVVSAREQVAQAQEGVQRALEGVQNASEGVEDALRDQQRTSASSAEAIADAQRSLTRAQQSYSDALYDTGVQGSASMRALEIAMGKLGPAGQEFARFWAGLLPQFRELRNLVQQGMFPGLQEAITDILTVNGPLLAVFMTNMGTALGDLFREFGDMMTSPQWMEIWRTFSEYAPIFMTQFGQVGLAMLTFFGELFQGLAPYAKQFGDTLVGLAQSSAEWIAAFVDGQTFRDFMAWLFDKGPIIFGDLWEIAKALGNLLIAFEPLGMLVLGALGEIAEWLNSLSADQLGLVAGAVVGLVIALQFAYGALALVSGAFTLAGAAVALWVFLAVAAVAALVLLYTHSETFRDIVDGVFRAIGAVISWVWENITKPYFEFLVSAFTSTSEWLQQVWNDILMPVFVAIGDVLMAVWHDILEPIFSMWGEIFGILGGWIGQIWTDIIKPVWELIASVLVETWDIVRPIFELLGLAFGLVMYFIEGAWKNVGKPIFDFMIEIVLFLWRNVFDPAFSAIISIFGAMLDTLSFLWRTIGKPIFDFIQAVVESLVAIFSGNFDQLGKIWKSFWDSLKNAASQPVNFVIKFVLNEGIFKAFNWVIDNLGLPADWKVGNISQVGDPSTHFAAGGRVPGWSPNDKADNIPAMLTAGEFVHPVAAVDYYGTDAMEMMRKRKIPREVFQYYSQGGPVQRLASGGQIFDMTRRVFPRAKLNSAYRPGDSGYHGRNQAADLGEEGFAGGIGRPYIAAMKRWWVDNFGRQMNEIIYNGLGNDRTNVKDGRSYPYALGTQLEHMNHLHLALAAAITSLSPGAVGGPMGATGGGTFGSSSLLGGIWDSVTGVLDSLKDSVTKPLADMAARFGDNKFTQILGGIPGKIIDGMWKTVSGPIGELWKDLTSYTADPNSGASLASGANVDAVRAVARTRGWGDGPEWSALQALIQKESGFRNTAQNPNSTAYGLFQFLDSTWAGVGYAKTSNPTIQTQAGLAYIASRYKTPSGALAFHRAHNWYSEGGEVTDDGGSGKGDAPTLYDTGGWLPPGVTTVLNATNKPEPILTGQQWEELTRSRGGNNDDSSVIGQLHLHEVQADLSEAIGEVNHWARVYRNGGRYAGAGTGS